jgi:hypothetical protein
METDNITNLQGLFARAFKKLYAKMGREEIERFCLAISRNEEFLTGKRKLRLPMDLEPTESVKVSTPEHHPRKRKRKLDQSERLDMTAQDFYKNAVNNVKRLIEGHWHELSTPSVELFSCQPEADLSVRKRRLNQHLALLQETRDDEIRWMWRGIKLVQHLRSHEAFLDESGYVDKERNSQRARDHYFSYIYKGCELDATKEKKARGDLSDHLRYGRRWKIFLDALTDGFIIVCGLNFAKKVM